MAAVSSTTLSTDVRMAGDTLCVSALSARDALILDASPAERAKALYAGAAPSFAAAKLPLMRRSCLDPNWAQTAHALSTHFPCLIFDVCRLIASYLPRSVSSADIPALYAQMEGDLQAKAIALPPPTLIAKVEILVTLPPLPLSVLFEGSYPAASAPFKLYYNTGPHYQFLVYRRDRGQGQAVFEPNPEPEPLRRAVTALMPSWTNTFTLLVVPLFRGVVDADKMTLLHFSTSSLPLKDAGTRDRTELLQELHQRVPEFRPQLELEWERCLRAYARPPGRGLKRKLTNEAA